MGKSAMRALDYSEAMGDNPAVRRQYDIPIVGFCAEKKQLMNEFLQAIHELGSAQAEQAKALIEGDLDFSRFDVLIHMANEKKDWVKYALLAHVEQHRC